MSPLMKNMLSPVHLYTCRRHKRATLDAEELCGRELTLPPCWFNLIVILRVKVCVWNSPVNELMQPWGIHHLILILYNFYKLFFSYTKESGIYLKLWIKGE